MRPWFGLHRASHPFPETPPEAIGRLGDILRLVGGATPAIA